MENPIKIRMIWGYHYFWKHPNESSDLPKKNIPSMYATLPKTNIAPENRPLEKEIPIGNHHFRCYVSFQGCMFVFMLVDLYGTNKSILANKKNGHGWHWVYILPMDSRR